ncbi:MAG: 50S ribosomal protein L15 [Candidatus Nomurabacteria bacterium]|jgi:large subunit ribosomal protein L15|nr:50S ribosomal protein L15 [Candidatus Nomurabacteria bacterium]
MKYHELKVEAHHDIKRVGRGISSGQGKTAGRGTKGQKARTGHSKMPAGFAGGQKAFMQAIPKTKGFKSFHKKAEVVYTDMLNGLSGKVDNFALAANSLISEPFVKVKILTRDELTAKIEISTQFASANAIKMIEKAGGKFEKVEVPQKPKKGEK